MAVQMPARYKADDMWDTPDDGNRYEVIDGALYVSPPPGEPHQDASGNLYGLIWSWVRPRRAGRVYAAPLGVRLDDENGVQPDLVYVSRDRSSIITPRGVEGAPDLVVEILSPSTRRRDTGIKRRRFAAARIPHYWVVDPRLRTLTPYRLEEGEYVPIGTFGPRATFEPELFPGLRIPIDEIWSD
jgi:Uma2 family endonuclease